MSFEKPFYDLKEYEERFEIKSYVRYRKWTYEEMEFLVNNYTTMQNVKIANKLNRGREAITNMAYKLKINDQLRKARKLLKIRDVDTIYEILKSTYKIPIPKSDIIRIQKEELIDNAK